MRYNILSDMKTFNSNKVAIQSYPSLHIILRSNFDLNELKLVIDKGIF